MAPDAPDEPWSCDKVIERVILIEKHYGRAQEDERSQHGHACEEARKSMEEESRLLFLRNDVPKDIRDRHAELILLNMNHRLGNLDRDLNVRLSSLEEDMKKECSKEWKKLGRAPAKSFPRQPKDIESTKSSERGAPINREASTKRVASQDVEMRDAPGTRITELAQRSVAQFPDGHSTQESASNNAQTTQSNLRPEQQARTSPVIHVNTEPQPVEALARTPIPAKLAANGLSPPDHITPQATMGPTGKEKRKVSTPDSGHPRSAKRGKYEVPDGPPLTDRTVSFEQVYQNGNAVDKHQIIQYGKHWYILFCEEHGVHFRQEALVAAAKHIDSTLHGNQGRYHDHALKTLGYHVVDCTPELAAKHNQLVTEAFANGYRPPNPKVHKTRAGDGAGGINSPASHQPTSQDSPTGRQPAAQDSPASQQSTARVKTEPSENLDGRGRSGNAVGLDGTKVNSTKGKKTKTVITNPTPGHLYRGTEKPKYPGAKPQKFMVMVLAWKRLDICGHGDKLLGQTDLLLDAQRKSCYTYDQDGITGWAPGYEDGGPFVTERWFPIVWYELKSDQFGWLRAVELSHYNMDTQKPLSAPEIRARKHHALGREFVEKNRAGAPQPQASLPWTGPPIVIEDSDDTDDDGEVGTESATVQNGPSPVNQIEAETSTQVNAEAKARDERNKSQPHPSDERPLSTPRSRPPTLEPEVILGSPADDDEDVPRSRGNNGLAVSRDAQQVARRESERQIPSSGPANQTTRQQDHREQLETTKPPSVAAGDGRVASQLKAKKLQHPRSIGKASTSTGRRSAQELPRPPPQPEPSQLAISTATVQQTTQHPSLPPKPPQVAESTATSQPFNSSQQQPPSQPPRSAIPSATSQQPFEQQPPPQPPKQTQLATSTAPHPSLPPKPPQLATPAVTAQQSHQQSQPLKSSKLAASTTGHANGTPSRDANVQQPVSTQKERSVGQGPPGLPVQVVQQSPQPLPPVTDVTQKDPQGRPTERLAPTPGERASGPPNQPLQRASGAEQQELRTQDELQAPAAKPSNTPSIAFLKSVLNPQPEHAAGIAAARNLAHQALRYQTEMSTNGGQSQAATQSPSTGARAEPPTFISLNGANPTQQQDRWRVIRDISASSPATDSPSPRPASPAMIKPDYDAKAEFSLAGFKTNDEPWNYFPEPVKLTTDQDGVASGETSGMPIAIDVREMATIQYNSDPGKEQIEIVLTDKAGSRRHLLFRSGGRMDRMKGLKFQRWVKQMSPGVAQLDSNNTISA